MWEGYSPALLAGSAADPFSGGSAADMRSDPPSCALPYDNGRWTAATTVFSRRESVGAPVAVRSPQEATHGSSRVYELHSVNGCHKLVGHLNPQPRRKRQAAMRARLTQRKSSRKRQIKRKVRKQKGNAIAHTQLPIGNIRTIREHAPVRVTHVLC